MSIKTETLSETATFKALDREWTVPAKRHLSHILKLEERHEQGLPLTATFIIRTFLDADQFADLVALDPDENQLDDVSNGIADALGMGGSGNSEPSSASS